MNARFYVSVIGRFASADTIVPDPANPQSFNRYSYTNNNPLRYIDPSGHAACQSLDGSCYAKETTPITQKAYEDSLLSQLKSQDAKSSASHSPDLVGGQEPSITISDLIRGDINWSDWTHTRWFPDYFKIQATVGPVVAGVTVDDYSNWYFSLGGSLGPESIAASGRAAGGWIVAKQVASEERVGVDWNLQKGNPSEHLLERNLTGWSAGGGGGFILGADGNITLSTTDAPIISFESGLYSPQFGGGVTYSWLVYDNGSNTPWLWQR